MFKFVSLILAIVLLVAYSLMNPAETPLQLIIWFSIAILSGAGSAVVGDLIDMIITNRRYR